MAVPAGATAMRGWRGTWRLVGQHRAFAVLLVAAGLLRVLVTIAYQPAFWYFGDSGSYISMSMARLMPNPSAALGYVVFLKVLRHTGTLFSVVAVQHLLGLAVATAVYALLVRRGLRPWMACLAAVPLLFDSFLITMEHYILVETLYLSLLAGAAVVLLWRPTPNVVTCALSGVLFAGAWFVKPFALPLAVIVFGYLVVRRTGWRRWAAFALAFAIPYGLVVGWLDGRTSPYGSNNIAYYARVAEFAHCDQLTLSDAERALCPTPEQSGKRPDWYIWTSTSPGFPYRQNLLTAPVLRDFAVDVVRQQPADYARVVGREIAAHFIDRVTPGADYSCLDGQYTLPATTRVDGPGVSYCPTLLASGGFRFPAKDRGESPGPSALTTTLSRYSLLVRTPDLVKTGVLGLTLAAWLAYRRRRTARTAGPDGQADGQTRPAEPPPPGPAERSDLASRPDPAEPSDGRDDRALVRDAGAMAVLAVAIVVLPVLVFMYEPRYALPALPFFCLAAGLAWGSFLCAGRRVPAGGPPAAVGPDRPAARCIPAQRRSVETDEPVPAGSD